FAAKQNQPVDLTNVSIIKLKNNFASGGISFGPTSSGEGGAFLARLVNDAWTIDYEGNGSVDCVKLKALGYTADVLSGFCD
ncbi:MAG: hypothetical protein NT116_06580, partial [Candidatus Parcubacteria bacterium]|nr:hypothetical protein [Candidatus Parcubacteria bacterium]